LRHDATFTKDKRMIDSHHHFWNYDPVTYDWVTDDMAVLRRDYLPSDLNRTVEGLGVTGVVTVQAERSLEQNRFLLAQAAACPLVRGVVGWVPLLDPKVEGYLEEWATHPLYKGVREILQGAPDAAYFDQPDFHRGLRALTAQGLPYDLLIFENQLAAGIRLVRAHPNLQFIVDHIAKPVIGETFSSGWAAQIRELAREPNVWCKFSGLITEVRTPTWTIKQLQPYGETVLEAFGVERLMFGSDWPVCLVRGSYADWLQAVKILTSALSENERHFLFSETARRAYRLS
jgi:L-fuconolactonase